MGPKQDRSVGLGEGDPGRRGEEEDETSMNLNKNEMSFSSLVTLNEPPKPFGSWMTHAPESAPRKTNQTPPGPRTSEDPSHNSGSS